LYNSRNRIGGAHLSADLVEKLQVYDAWVSTNAMEVPVRFEFSKMRDEEAQEIARWRYVPPYDFYDSVSDPDDLAELLDPRRRGDDYFSAIDEKGALVGLFQFKRDGKVVEVGLGLRPDLTGKGLGRGFLLAGLDFARRSFSPDVFRLSVATFNERAIKVYEGVGFVHRRTYRHETNGGVYEFLEMERRA
jgi:[ribosomal protein S18]-alanine N-acetyltransferase